jgi:hypothetical protein
VSGVGALESLKYLKDMRIRFVDLGMMRPSYKTVTRD